MAKSFCVLVVELLIWVMNGPRPLLITFSSRIGQSLLRSYASTVTVEGDRPRSKLRLTWFRRLIVQDAMRGDRTVCEGIEVWRVPHCSRSCNLQVTVRASLLPTC